MRAVVVVLVAVLFPVNAAALKDVVCAGISHGSGIPNAPANVPTFAYLNWPSQADVDSLESWVGMVLPLYGGIGGPAAYTGVVEIMYDPNYGGYSMSLKRIWLSYRPSLFPAQAQENLIHDWGHMWRDDEEVWYSVVEEGLAEAMVHEVFALLPAFYNQRYRNLGHKTNGSVTEDIANRPEVGSANGLWSMHHGLRVARYAMADWLMTRLAAQREDFYRNFQEELLDRNAADSTFCTDPVRVTGLLRELVPAVDGVPFDSFWNASHLTSLSPPQGDQIFIRGDVIGCYSIRREGWNEVGYAGIPVDWEAHNRFGDILGQGTINTGPKGQAFVTLPTTPYRGRIIVRFVSHMPNGTQETTVGDWYGGNGTHLYDGLGIFGIVAGESGSVTIETLDRSESYSVPIDRGQFSCPAFEGRDGAFRLTWDGRERIVRKDAAPYLVLLNEETTTPVGIADVPANFRPFTVDCAPNPFTAAIHLTASRPLQSVMVYDVSGRWVRTLEAQGAMTVIWDGRDKQGNHAPSGVYFYRLSMGGAEVTGKVTRY